MNPMVYRLLKGYLIRSVWLYAFFAVLQFMMLGAFWAAKYDRVPVVGVLLGFWGAIVAVNNQSLVWRSLPLGRRDASLFRWWAIAGVPGICLTLLTLIAWVSQHSSGFPTPPAATILEGILATWAVLGILATLSRAAGWSAKKFGTARIIAALAIGAALLLAYGVPVGPGARPYSIILVCAGVILLFVSAERARRGLDWRWPDLANRSSRSAHKHASIWLTPHYGLSAILFPLAQRTAIFATVATVIIVSLQRIFPQASVALFWVYFIGLSTTGFLLTYQVRMAFQPLRCLPLSVKRLAVFLMLFGALPGLATLGLTLLINRGVLSAGLDIGQVATFAFIIIAIQVFPVSQMTMPRRSKFFEYWMPRMQRFLVPVYMGLMAAGWNEAYGRFTWMRWPLQAGGVVLCITGYFVLVQQLRSGIRPSSNENVFSPG
jgi:hypothetical protein